METSALRTSFPSKRRKPSSTKATGKGVSSAYGNEAFMIRWRQATSTPAPTDGHTILTEPTGVRTAATNRCKSFPFRRRGLATLPVAPTDNQTVLTESAGMIVEGIAASADGYKALIQGLLKGVRRIQLRDLSLGKRPCRPRVARRHC